MNPAKTAADGRKSKLRNLYGLSVADYEALYRDQGGVCAFCGGVPRERRLAIDHDHETGLPRGLLCLRCNTMLGCAQDRPDRLRKGADYIEAWKKRHAEVPSKLIPFPASGSI